MKASNTPVDIAYRSDIGSAQHMVVHTRENVSQTLCNHFLKYPQLSNLITVICIQQGETTERALFGVPMVEGCMQRRTHGGINGRRIPVCHDAQILELDLLIGDLPFGSHSGG